MFGAKVVEYDEQLLQKVEQKEAHENENDRDRVVLVLDEQRRRRRRRTRTERGRLFGRVQLKLVRVVRLAFACL